MALRCTGPHAFIAADGCAKLTALQRVAGHPISNVLYFQHEGHWSQDELAALGSAFAGGWSDWLGGSVTSDVQVYEYRVKDVSRADGPFVGLGIPNNGFASPPCVAPSVGLAITCGTGLAGRDRRGRYVIAGIPVAAFSGDFLVGGSIGLYSALFRNVISETTSAVGAAHVVVSYCSGGSWRGAALVTPVVNYYDSGIACAARRRMGAVVP